ncbi:MAG: sugar ABC transporter ATP-binding protein, partial [Rhizobiaceae bacterium]|nr:sugar ABC transporter ATP-binding protein [Rhizobiaceae bacterium]
MSPAPAIIELVGVGKSFSGLPVLSGIDLAIEPGKVHAIVGENGAGKSTLGKVIGGVHRHDAGQIRVDGREVSFNRPAAALDVGIAVMQQEIALARDLTVMENTLLGREPRRAGFISGRQCRSRFASLLQMTEFDLSADDRVGDLPLAKQQQVEILRALARDARLIVMDEPTAALPAEEVRHLHNVVRMLTARGVAIVYVSHFLDETLALSDTVTVLRNGHLVATRPATDWTVPGLVTAMLGHSLEANYPALPEVGQDVPPRISIRELADGDRVRDANLDVRSGEIVGLFGLVGSGRSELAHALFGASPILHGKILLEGQSHHPHSPSQAFHNGVALLPESRKDQGLCLDHSKLDNGALNSLDRYARLGFIDRREKTA